MAATSAGDNTLRERMRAFPDEAACVRHLEQQRWPAGIVCPLCSASGKMYRRTRVGVYKCAACRQEFSVRKGTIYEESRLPLQKWYMAAFLMATSRKGISSCQLAREIGVTQKTAWFVLGRLRKSSEQASHKAGTLPGPGEADESDVGGKNKNRPASKNQRNGRTTRAGYFADRHRQIPMLSNPGLIPIR